MNADPRGTVLEAAARWLAVALLVGVAVSQVWLARIDGRLTPAKGGGFGLFSTVDKLYNRTLFAYAIRNDGLAPIRIHASQDFEHALRSAQSWPSRKNLEIVARTLGRRLDDDQLVAVRVEVWKRDYDSGDGVARRVRVAELVIPRANLARD